MQELVIAAARVATLLRARGETVAVAESSAGGLVAAALLAQPGASAFFVGGAVVYTRHAREALLGITAADLANGMRASTEAYALLLAHRLNHRLGATWGLAETGAAGPAGNGYGDAAGHSCCALTGPSEAARTLETGHGDRLENMRAFALAALKLLEDALSTQKPLQKP